MIALAAILLVQAAQPGPLDDIPSTVPARPPGWEHLKFGTPFTRFASHPYTYALAALANYEGCVGHAPVAEVAALAAVLRASEETAREKGLGPELERLHRDYLAVLAVSTMIACAGEPMASLAEARRAIGDFERWVFDLPPG